MLLKFFKKYKKRLRMVKFDVFLEAGLKKGGATRQNKE